MAECVPATDADPREIWCGGICRYLALVAGLMGEADFVFIPEWPPNADWPVKMCKVLHQARSNIFIGLLFDVCQNSI
jgi:hypothetical protein